jgi:hypothetical protein
MKVKSIVSGVTNGINSAMEHLDAETAALGDITIHNLTDTLFDGRAIEGNGSSVIIRVVIYDA